MTPRREVLTDELVAGLQPLEKQFYVWDKKTSGFGVRVGASGSRSFVGKINHPDRNRAKWWTLQAKTTEAARLEYAALLQADPDAVNRWRGHAADRFPRQVSA